MCVSYAAAEDVIKSMTHSSVVSDHHGVSDDGIVYIMVVNIPRVSPPAQYGRSQERKLSIF